MKIDCYKFLIGIITVAIISSGVFFLPAKRAEAFWGIGDISFDPSVFTQATITAGTDIKTWVMDFVLKPIAWQAANMMIERMTNDTVNWINNGFKGPNGETGPLFVTNPGDFLKDAADQASGIFFNEFRLTKICLPFRVRVELALRIQQPFQQRMWCTLSQVVENIGAFENNFLAGGWAGWLAMTTQPQNNIYGAYLESADELIRRQQQAQSYATLETSWGSGFISKKGECLEWAELPPGDVGPPVCLRYETITPGSVIQGRLNTALGADFGRLEVADDIDEVIGALFSQLFKKLINTGLRSMSGGGGGGGGGGGIPSSCGSASGICTSFDICMTLGEATSSLPILYDFAEANKDQFHDNENLEYDSDVNMWNRRVQRADSAIQNLTDSIAGFRDPRWDKVEIQLSKAAYYFDAVTMSLAKNADLDLDEDLDVDDPPVQGATGLVRVTGLTIDYLELLEQAIGNCANPDTTKFGTIPDPDWGFGTSDGDGGGGVCKDPGGSTANYSGDLEAAIDAVIADNPNGIADAPNTKENSFTFLNYVAEELQSNGFNATTNVKNGNDNPNSGDLIAVWRPSDTKVERYDAVISVGAGDRPMRDAATAGFTGDILLSCVF